MSRLKIFLLSLTAVILILAGVFAYYLYRPESLSAPVTDGAGYELYANKAGRYAAPVPSGWGILDEGNTSAVMFPDSKDMLKRETLETVRLSRDLGMSINTLTPEQGADLVKAYERLTDNTKQVTGTFSPIVWEVRIDKPVEKNSEDFSTATYWVLTGKRVYVVETVHRSVEAGREVEGHVSQLLYGLREE